MATHPAESWRANCTWMSRHCPATVPPVSRPCLAGVPPCPADARPCPQYARVRFKVSPNPVDGNTGFVSATPACSRYFIVFPQTFVCAGSHVFYSRAVSWFSTHRSVCDASLWLVCFFGSVRVLGRPLRVTEPCVDLGGFRRLCEMSDSPHCFTQALIRRSH